jgi:hypothetical protein
MSEKCSTAIEIGVIVSHDQLLGACRYRSRVTPTAASDVLECGAPITVVQALLGPAHLSSTAIYLWIAKLDERRAASEADRTKSARPELSARSVSTLPLSVTRSRLSALVARPARVYSRGAPTRPGALDGWGWNGEGWLPRVDPLARRWSGAQVAAVTA